VRERKGREGEGQSTAGKDQGGAGQGPAEPEGHDKRGEFMNRLKDKIALITGGTTGIGLATAQLFIEEGATVIVTGRNPETLEKAEQILGASGHVIAADTGDLEAIKNLISIVKEKFKRIDALFVNAGIAKFGKVADVTPEMFDEMFNINVRGAFFTVQHALPLMPDGSAILLMASVAASKGNGTASIYSASKAAVRSFGRTLAGDLLPRRIRVNTISPGPIETPILGKLDNPGGADAIRKAFIEGVPMKRMGHADEVAKAALFLLSDESSFTTGGELFVDGGKVDL
jgi:NAD(P)-dependent dehydrogenase (short-subunit alcohol dehydrogenase family)